MPTIKIHHLKIHLKSISPQSARNLADGLGTELIAQLADQQHLPKEPHAISSIDAGTLTTQGKTTPTDIRRQAARQITESITLTINPPNREK
ncbi:MAG: hypothetical protein K8R34_16830 [Methanosarcinales archaeon]|nr:hypothetical protein [Methanosarcinales archaeon]MCD4810245.1 hypothetical protein [Methanosarcinales archaeon]